MMTTIRRYETANWFAFLYCVAMALAVALMTYTGSDGSYRWVTSLGVIGTIMIVSFIASIPRVLGVADGHLIMLGWNRVVVPVKSLRIRRSSAHWTINWKQNGLERSVTRRATPLNNEVLEAAMKEQPPTSAPLAPAIGYSRGQSATLQGLTVGVITILLVLALLLNAPLLLTPLSILPALAKRIVMAEKSGWVICAQDGLWLVLGRSAPVRLPLDCVYGVRPIASGRGSVVHTSVGDLRVDFPPETTLLSHIS